MSVTMWRYYQETAAAMAERSLSEFNTAEDWMKNREQLHTQFMLSMGLHPFPERCDLKLTEYGEFQGEGYKTRKIAYQILPDCWGTANVYIPLSLGPGERRPAVLYACGHSAHGIDYYQRHAIMWARRGYVCMVFDTIEQHDNPGEHHGLTASLKRFDWISRGYTAAGGELWNSIRALDAFLEQPEVDPERVGVTGVSGGGSMSFYLAVADSRIKVTAPCGGVSVARYALYKRHLMTHCGCYYYHNLFGRDVSEYAALIAPRPFLLCFPTHDKHFTPPEFHFLFRQIRKIYNLLGVTDNCQLSEHAGPHGYGFHFEILKDINDWFDKHLIGEPRPEGHLSEVMQPEKLVTVFNGAAPVPNHLSLLPELLAPVKTEQALPQNIEEWPALREAYLGQLRAKVFPRILDGKSQVEFEQLGDWRHSTTWIRERYLGRIDGMEVFMDLFLPRGKINEILVGVTEGDEISYDLFQRLEGLRGGDCALILIEPRGTGLTEPTPRQTLFIMRAGGLTGITPFMLRVQDLCQTLQFLRDMPALQKAPLCLYARGESAAASVYAGLLTSTADGFLLDNLPASHLRAAYTPAILQVTDIGQALGFLAPRPVALIKPEHGRGTWASRAYVRIDAEEAWITSPPSIKMGLDALFEKLHKQE